MKLELDHIQALHAVAIEAALSAGEYISSRAAESQSLDVRHKEDRSSLAAQVVTEVDIKSQELILNKLLPTCTEFDLALLSEEHPDDKERLTKDYFWCIDPLDGTLPFIKGSHGYSVSIGLVSKDGKSQIGVIYDPKEDVLYDAFVGSGARRNGEDWVGNVNKTSPKGDGIDSESTFKLIADRSFSEHPRFEDLAERLKECYGPVELINWGGGAMNAMWVLENAPACYLKFPRPENRGGSLWDYAASACIFNEFSSGVVCSDIFGEPMALNNPESTFMNHKGILYTSSEKIASDGIRIFKEMDVRE